MCGYSEESNSYRVWNQKTHRVVDSRSGIFLETPSYLLFPPSTFSPLQDLLPPSWDFDDDPLDSDYISPCDLLRDIRDYTGVLDFTADIPVNHESASGVSADPQLQGFIDQIRDFTRRYLLTPVAPLPGPNHQRILRPEQ